jgi:hypothetical protein
VQKELEATLATRRELGPEHEEHLIAGFLERIDKEIDRRVEERVGQRVAERRSPPHLPLPNLLAPPVLGPAAGIVAVAGIFGGVVGVLSVSRRMSAPPRPVPGTETTSSALLYVSTQCSCRLCLWPREAAEHARRVD